MNDAIEIDADGIHIYQGRWRALGVDNESKDALAHTHPTIVVRTLPPPAAPPPSLSPASLASQSQSFHCLATSCASPRLRLSPVTARNLRPCTSSKENAFASNIKTLRSANTQPTLFFYYLSSFTKQHIPTSPTVTRFNFHTTVSHNGNAGHSTLVLLSTTSSIYCIPTFSLTPSAPHIIFSSHQWLP